MEAQKGRVYLALSLLASCCRDADRTDGVPAAIPESCGLKSGRLDEAGKQKEPGPLGNRLNIPALDS